MQLPQFGSWWLHLRSWNSILHSKHQSPELESVAVLPRLVVGSDLNLSIVPHEWVAFTWQETWKCNLPCKVAESEMIIPRKSARKITFRNAFVGVCSTSFAQIIFGNLHVLRHIALPFAHLGIMLFADLVHSCSSTNHAFADAEVVEHLQYL